MFLPSNAIMATSSFVTDTPSMVNITPSLSLPSRFWYFLGLMFSCSVSCKIFSKFEGSYWHPTGNHSAGIFHTYQNLTCLGPWWIWLPGMLPKPFRWGQKFGCRLLGCWPWWLVFFPIWRSTVSCQLRGRQLFFLGLWLSFGRLRSTFGWMLVCHVMTSWISVASCKTIVGVIGVSVRQMWSVWSLLGAWLSWVHFWLPYTTLLL